MCVCYCIEKFHVLFMSLGVYDSWCDPSHLDPKVSNRELMVMVESVMSDENRQVLSAVQREFGISDGET